ncbi:MAG: hypothetical protein IJ065_10060 [Eubacterium sp.]|nr:hypothetical protein [Eubacterium sp.]
MRGKSVKKILTLFMALFVAVAVSIPVLADGFKYDPINGTTTQFDKYLVVKDGETNPAVTFGFVASAPTEVIPAAEGTLEVKPGPDSDKIDIGKAEFSVNAADQNPTDSQKTTIFNGVSFESYKYAKQTVNVDLSAVEFSEPGVYRYYITEDNSNVVFGHIGDLTKTLDVYVKNKDGDNSKELEVEGYVMYEGKVTSAPKATATGNVTDKPNGAEAAGKNNRFINTYPTQTLTITKTVTGNQGSRDKYFKFTVNISGENIVDDAQYYITGLDTFGNEEKVNNATKYTKEDINNANKNEVKGSDLKNGINIYLQHGDEVTISGLPLNCTYQVEEDAEEYKKSATVKKEDETEAAEYGEAEKTFEGNTIVAFTNNKQGVIPTGILLSATPWIVAGIVIIAGIIFFALRSKKRYDEE